MTAAQIEPVGVHPRRRPALNNTLPALMAEPPARSSKTLLRKGETFNTPTTPSTERDPVLNVRSLPRRTLTSLEAIAASEEHMTSLLGRLTLESEEQQPDSSLSADANESGSELLSDAQKIRTSHSHDSDSGLGSSVSSVTDSCSDEEKINEDAHLEVSGITSSKPTFDPTSSARRQLGLSACKQIERYMLLPILKEHRLKAFHPLVQTVPRRIVNKQIVCLRDLEKTLLSLAPKSSSCRNAYLQFCEFTIQCLHTTVSHLNVHDQRLPTDRPYTNGYFLDLVSQVRRYAAMVQASRDAAQAAEPGEEKAKNLIVPTVKLEGGLSQNGRPAELVVTDGSTSTSMATGKAYDPESPPIVFKREHAVNDDDEADEGVQRSMARRKKNAPPMDINQKCDYCDKVFKRPCDLTKHEKTHSRPWKCTEPTCRFAQFGWPTEKERDRHVNDKHSDTPKLFKCKFQPCTYASKRESNCKQHMEKAHGWVYIRSKNNSRGGSSKSSLSVQPGTPSVASTPASKVADIATPISGSSASPLPAPMFSDSNFNFNDPPAPLHNDDFALAFESSPFAGPPTGLGDDLTLFPTSANLEAFQAQFQADDPNGLIPALEMHRQSMNSMSIPSANSVPDLMGASMSFDGSPQAPDHTSVNFDLEWSRLDMPPMQEDHTTMNMQFGNGTNGVARWPSNQAINASQNYMNYGANGKVSGLSPNAQGSLMLFSPGSGVADEHLSNQHEYEAQHAGNDFTLYDQFRMQASAAPAQASTYQYAQSTQMFPSIQQDSMFGDVQSWAEHPYQGTGSENGLPDMDLGYMGTK